MNAFLFYKRNAFKPSAKSYTTTTYEEIPYECSREAFPSMQWQSLTSSIQTSHILSNLASTVPWAQVQDVCVLSLKKPQSVCFRGVLFGVKKKRV